MKNFVYKTHVLASESAVFLNSKSDSRKYAKYKKVYNALKIKHLRFYNILLVFKKGLVTLQREPFHTLIRLSSLAH